MQIIDGNHNRAYVYADYIDDKTIDQIRTICNHRVSSGFDRIAIMPDTHAGKGSVVGFTAKIRDRICPNIVGVDIGCSVVATKIDAQSIDFNHIDDVIRNTIPSGQNVRTIDDRLLTRDVVERVDQFVSSLRAVSSLRNNRDYYVRSIGTVGGGNHFIEIDRDSDGSYWLLVHSGSRRLGVDLCKHYMSVNRYHHTINDIKNQLIDCMKDNDLHSHISEVVNQFNRYRDWFDDVANDELRYITGDDMNDYLHDIAIVQQYASLNVDMINDQICREMNWNIVDKIRSVHNYIDTDNMIIRKGAIDASLGKSVIVPVNMAFGCVIGVGRGNSEMNYSAPHGAGRVLSRGESHNKLTIDQFIKSMDGIYSTCINENTLDESPAAYKTYDQIEHYLRDSVDVVDIIKPVYNFKAS